MSGGWLERLMKEAGGSLSFERFMHEALYHPEFGYYSAKIKTVGRHGDFSTTATINEVLGKAVAEWALSEHESILKEKPWTLIEVGAGEGALADAVIDEIGFLRRRQMRYFIVESSPVLEAKQRSRLRRRKNLSWFLSIENALKACEGRALIVSNELVDAFPVRVVRWNDDFECWQELSLELEAGGNGSVSETWVPLAAGDEWRERFSIFDEGPFGPKERRELHETFYRWLSRELKPNWKKGAMLTIDYGDEIPALYHRRPTGTVRAYFQQMKYECEEIYTRPGHQDLTADVNFTDLRKWGQSNGFGEQDYLTQREFILQYVPSLRGDKIHEADIEFVLSPHGAGSAFKVLHWRKV